MADEGKAPGGSRIGRTFKLAKLATSTSAHLAKGMARRAVGAEPGEDRLDRHRGIAHNVVDALGSMKGLAMKAGQILSYVDEWMPDDVRPAYRDVLRKLQAEAPKVPLADMLNVFIDEVGEPPDEVFAEFHDEPIAAASIGQVYRAVLKSGEEVAVKIQYPGIEKAIRADLKNLSLLENVLRASTLGRLDVKQSLQDIASKIEEELDYTLEATNQSRFAELYADHPQIVIPKIYDDYSHRRVLTSELLHGRTYKQVQEEASQDERNLYGRALYTFVFKSFHSHGLFNADPHPGNYVFLDAGRVGFLDFGCVQAFPLSVPHAFQRIIGLYWAGDEAAVREALPDSLGYPGEPSEEVKDFIYDYVTHLWEPIREDRPFRYSPEFTKGIMQRTRGGVALGAKVALAEGYPDTTTRGLALLNRLQLGFMSILAGIEAESNWHRLIQEFFIELEGARERPPQD